MSSAQASRLEGLCRLQAFEPYSFDAMSFLEAHGIVKTYVVGGTTLTVLRDLDLTVEAGEMVAIMGASGVGKSTLLHVSGWTGSRRAKAASRWPQRI